MGAAAAIPMATQGASTLLGAQSSAAQADYQAKVAGFNARMATEAAADAIARGDLSAVRANEQGARVIGSSRAAIAAAGVNVGSGAAVDVLAATAGTTAQNIETIRTNAAREALGFKIQAVQFQNEQRMYQSAMEQNDQLAGMLLGGPPPGVGKNVWWGGNLIATGGTMPMAPLQSRGGHTEAYLPIFGK